MSNHDFWTDRLSDYLDGGLPERESAAVREHLAGCAACREVEVDLRELRGRARALGESTPERDLWPGIAARLGEDPLADEVIDLTRHLESPAHRRGTSSAKGVRVGVPQLIAAGLALLFGGWGLGAVFTPDAVGSGGIAAEPVSVVHQASTLVGEDDLADRVAALERTLERRAGDLTPETFAVLQRNLAVIDRALAESIAALEAEPESEYLRQHLQSSLARREAALSSAVRLIERSS